MGIVEKVLRAGEGKKLRRLHGLVPYVNELEPELQALSDDALRHKTVEFRERLDRGEELDELLIESFAVVREAAQRVIGQRHFDVQRGITMNTEIGLHTVEGRALGRKNV